MVISFNSGGLYSDYKDFLYSDSWPWHMHIYSYRMFGQLLDIRATKFLGLFFGATLPVTWFLLKIVPEVCGEATNVGCFWPFDHPLWTHLRLPQWLWGELSNVSCSKCWKCCCVSFISRLGEALPLSSTGAPRALKPDDHADRWMCVCWSPYFFCIKHQKTCR